MTLIADRATAEGHLDPVTFEVLKNAFTTSVDLMSAQILRTCHSFVIYARDFSCALVDAKGNTVMQGSQDVAVHVGTLHFGAQAILKRFEGDIHPGDIFGVNDPYSGGTHFNDVRIVRPIFAEGELIAFAMSMGHWSDMGGTVPGSFDVNATEHFGEGMRIVPVKLWDRGEFRQDVAELIVCNTRAPAANLGDMRAQAEATGVCEREIHRLVNKYGRDTVVSAFDEVQDYVERLARKRIAEMPDGEWVAVDYIDYDPAHGEGMVPVKVKMRIEGDQIHYDLSESAPAVASFLNSGFGASFSGVVAGTKTFFPDIPLNSGFYRAITCDLGPEGTVVNAGWPIAVTGFCSGPYEKIMSAIFELWSNLMPERAIACSFNLEYLLIGGRDGRVESEPYFMWYDWMVGGWGGRNGKDGANCTSPLFGVGLAVQPFEGQERLTPVVTSRHEIVTDSGGPGRYRGGCGVEKGGVLTEGKKAVMSYCCDRARNIAWGVAGGLPSTPHGVWLNKGKENELYLGAVFSNVPIQQGDTFTRPSAGGGGYGDPLERPADEVLEDVIDGYVSVDRAAVDYGVTVLEIDADLDSYEVDVEATKKLRAEIARKREGWLEEDPEAVAVRYRAGELSELDLIRQYGVIVEWGSGELFPITTQQFRDLVRKRAVAHWGKPA
jgi:N-methylhydantoinase B